MVAVRGARRLGSGGRSHVNWPEMRALVALQTCAGLLLGFVLAPFEHVHQGGADHEHAGVVHAHFYSLPSPHPTTGPSWDDIDDDHASAWSVNTFTLTLTARLASFIPSVGPALEMTLDDFLQPVEMVEQRAHAPPPRDSSIPRAPPC